MSRKKREAVKKAIARAHLLPDREIVIHNYNPAAELSKTKQKHQDHGIPPHPPAHKRTPPSK